MINIERADSLLQVAAEDAATDNRLAAIETLTHLPLEPDVWKSVAVAGSSVLDDLVENAALNAKSARVLARIPVRSIRKQLGQIARKTTHPGSLHSAAALARYGDDSGTGRLVAELKKTANPWLAERLACLPLEKSGAGKELFEHSLQAQDPMLRFWAAIALARLGEFEPLEQVWDSLIAAPDGSGHPLFPDAPPLFLGNPHTPYVALKHVHPPEQMRQFVQGLYKNDLQRLQSVGGLEAHLPKAAEIFVGGLTGMLDEYGDPSSTGIVNVSPKRNPADAGRAKIVAKYLLHTPYKDLGIHIKPDEINLLAELPPDQAGRVLTAGLRSLARAPETEKQLKEPMGYAGVNNAVIHLASALPPDLKISIGRLLDDKLVARLPRPALTWALARAGSGQLAEQLGPRILNLPSAKRTGELDWAREIAASLNAPAPFQGAGAVAEDSLPMLEVIDDTAKRAKTRDGGVKYSTFGQMAADSSVKFKMENRVPDVTTTSGETVPPVPPDSTHVAYPNFSFGSEPPVPPGTLVIEVALSSQRSAGTQGEAHFPAGDPETVHEFDVHLLVEDNSLWDTLQYSEAKGTLKKARFELKLLAPVAGASATVPVRANFYLKKRWSGEGRRDLELRPGAPVQWVETVQPPDEPEWHQAINIEPGAQPPDLIVRIQRSGIGTYVWSCLSPHLPLPQPKDPAKITMFLDSDADTFVRTHFAPLAAKKLDDLESKDLAGVGEIIYTATPEVFKTAYWAVWKHATNGKFDFESIQIITDEPSIPWELMRVSDDQEAPELAPEFLAVRHSVGRWLGKESAPLRQTIPVSAFAVSGSTYANIRPENETLPWVTRELDSITKKFSATKIELLSGPLVSFLEKRGTQALHLACHGQMSVITPLQSTLILEDDPKNLKVTTVQRTEVRRGLGTERPFVFLNACEVGGEAACLSLVVGFPAAFIWVGAAAVVSPLWAVNDEHAKDIAISFYESAFAPSPLPLGKVLREIRAKWSKDPHLTYLAYVLYGDPLARIYHSPKSDNPKT